MASGAASAAKESAEPGAAPKTWKRAGAATHAARISIGDKESLRLEGMQVKVDVDGFRARVVLDTYFVNDRSSTYEGNFQLRLPDGATPYFFAYGEMGGSAPTAQIATSDPLALLPAAEQRKASTAPALLMEQRAKSWSHPKEARIVPKETAAFAYTETQRRQVDPALLEWAGAGVFNGRVFPIAAHSTNRVVLAYDVNLVRAGNEFEYRLDVPEGIKRVAVDIAVQGKPVTEPKLTMENAGGRSYVHLEGANAKSLTLRTKSEGEPLLVGTDDRIGRHFAADVVANLPKRAASSEERAVFAIDTSLSSNPDRFNVFLKLLAATLENNRAELKKFAVLTFNVETAWWKESWVDNTPANVASLMQDMNALALEGATDVGAALAAATQPAWNADAKAKWDTFLLSDGAATWGESSKDAIASIAPLTKRGAVFAYQTGLTGTDTAMLGRVTRDSGGAMFSVVGEAEVTRASTAHRARPFRLVAVKGRDAEDVVVLGRPRNVYPGQSLLVAGRGVPSDLAIVVEQGGSEITVPVKLASAMESPLTARTYGQIATGALEELGSATAETAKAYAVHYRVTGETCSLVMLDSDADYARFDIKPEQESARVKAQLATAVLARAEAQLQGALSDPKLAAQRWLAELGEKPGMKVSLGRELAQVVATMPADAFVVRPRPLVAKSRTRSALSPAFAQALAKPGSLEYDDVTRESQARRSQLGNADALKALSSLVEQSPGDAILARDVGFSAMELGLPDHAFFLFRRVADARPWEPQSYRAMADVLARMQKTDLAMVYYEVAVRGTWDSRFGEFHKIASVDYARFLRRIAKGELRTSAPEFAKVRLAELNAEIRLDGADLVVMITWNTDGSDVDLHVREPSGEDCYYGYRQTKSGGELTQDVTQGYGPEMYVMRRAPKGAYAIRAHYFTQQRNRASARTKVYATILENWGGQQERITENVITLAEGKDEHDLLTVKR